MLYYTDEQVIHLALKRKTALIMCLWNMQQFGWKYSDDTFMAAIYLFFHPPSQF